jgi:exonuclease III
MAKLKFFTYNTKGLKDQTKRDSVFYWLKKKNLDIICLQEAHCEPDTLDKWKKEWGGKIIASFGTGNSKGTCLLLKENLPISIKNTVIDENGRYVIIQGQIEETTFKIAGYYGPNNDDPTILLTLLKDLDSMEGTHTVLMGDFNLVLDVSIDKKGGLPTTHKKSQKLLLDWMEENNLYDIWRIQHQHNKTYTWKSNTKPRIFCRLDMLITSANVLNQCTNSTIGPGIRSDHSYVKMEIALDDTPRGRGFWKLDCTLLENQKFIEEIKEVIEETEINNPNTEAPLLWETVKCAIRGVCINYSARRKKEANTKINELEKKLQSNEQKLADNTNHSNIEQKEIEEETTALREELEREIETKGRWIAANIRTTIHELDEKPSKFFIEQGKTRSANKTIKRLVKDNGEEVTTQKEILGEQQKFYEKLYRTSMAKTDEEKEERREALEQLTSIEGKKIQEERWQEMTSDITEDELWKVVVSCTDNKSPGSDGLNNNFYKHFWHDIKHLLINSINHSLEHGQLSITQKQGIISLIPKANKDTSKLKNWRPITLLNQDYKYLAKCLANRCRKILPDIISPDQTGFVPNRIIGTNILKAQQMLDICEELQQEGLMACIDFEKAFDRIEWQFIWESLQYFNAPPKLIEWIKILYQDITTCIINNGHRSEFFSPTRGVRQGCPLSPILFVIAAEMLAIQIRNNKSIQGLYNGTSFTKISQFADDTVFYLQNNPNEVKEVFKTLEVFSILSGLKINKEKTEILPLGPTSFNSTVKETQQYLKDHIKMLGIFITKGKENLIKMNYDPIVEKIENTISQWQFRGLSLHGKIVILKTQIVSKLIYALSVLPSPNKEFLTNLQKKLFDFVWDGKGEAIKRDTLIGDYKDGGYRMPDLLLYSQSLKIIWLKRLTTYEGNWTEYITNMLPNNDVTYFMNCPINFADLLKKPRKDNIWSEILLKWCIINQNFNQGKKDNLESIFDENLWWNSRIKIDKKVVYYEDWANHNINKVHHLFKDTGEILTHKEFEEKFQIKTPFTKFYGIRHSIRNTWGKFFDSTTYEETQENPNLAMKLDTKEKSSRVIYRIMLGRKCIQPQNKKEKWEKDTDQEISELKWKQHLEYSRKLTINSRLKSWIYKYNLRVIPYNSRLYKMGLEPTNICQFCKENEQTISHLYWECPIIEPLWTELEKITGTSINKSMGLLGYKPTIDRKILGIEVKCMLTRYYIHVCKCKGVTPNIKGQKVLIDTHRKRDWEIASRNNSMKRYEKVWGKAYTE